MNKGKGFSKIWFLVLLLLAFVNGCAENKSEVGPLVSFIVAPATTSIPVTGTLQYTAIAIYSNGSSRDVTASSNWSAGSPGVTFGAITGLATGAIANVVPVVITATFDGKTATAALTVNAATSKGLRLAPASASIPVTGKLQYTAIETFSDGTSFDRTTNSATTWSSSSLANATIIPNGANAGLATGVSATAAGSPVVITATFGVGGPSATANLTVNAATSQGLKLTPASASIPVTGTQQYAALETFSDGTSIDRTKDPATTWSSSSIANATISPSGVNAGLATGKSATAAGVPVVITATFGVGGPSATASLNVTAATSTNFVVTPLTATISVNGATQQFAAIETFSDGTSFDRTTASTWTAVNAPPGGPFVATIGLNTGVATGAAIGTSTITASYLSGGVTKTAPATLTVTAPNPGLAGSYPDLKSAAPFGIIGYNAITNSAGPSHIYGNIALTQPGPGGTIASVVGFIDGGTAPLLTSTLVTNSNGVSPGLITAADNGTATDIAALPQLLLDLRAAYDDLFNRAAPVTPITTPATAAAAIGGGTFPAAAPDLSGYVLKPGIYTTAGTFGLSNTLGPLVLDAGGNPDALFVIRSTAVGVSGLTSTTGSVALLNGAQSKNIFWLVDNATIGAGTFFQGTVVAGHAITLLAHANVEGRMLAGALGLVSGAITLTDTNVVTVPK